LVQCQESYFGLWRRMCLCNRFFPSVLGFLLPVISQTDPCKLLFRLENRKYGRRDPFYWPRNIIYPQKLALTSLTSGSRSVVIVNSRTKSTEFFCLFYPSKPLGVFVRLHK
jgi:hypothetical protein